jgi:hypothetical protein
LLESGLWNVFFTINFKLKHNNAMGMQKNRKGNSAEIQVKLKNVKICPSTQTNDNETERQYLPNMK